MSATLFCIALVAAQPTAHGRPLPESVSRPGVYQVYENQTVSRTVERTETRLCWCYDWCRCCWYQAQIQVSVPMTVNETKTIVRSAEVQAVLGAPGAISRPTSITLSAPRSAGAIDDRIRARVLELFPPTEYDLVAVNVGQNKNQVDLRSKQEVNGTRTQVVASIDPADPRNVDLTVAILHNPGDDTQSAQLADKALGLAKRALVEN